MLFKKHAHEIRQDELLTYYCLIIRRYYGDEKARALVKSATVSAKTNDEVMETVKAIYKKAEPYVSVHFLKLKDEEEGNVIVYNIHTEVLDKPRHVYYVPNFIS